VPASADATLNQKLEPEITAPNTCGKPWLLRFPSTNA